MSCSQCIGIEELFNEEAVTKELINYRKKGPDRITGLLVDALKAAGVEGKSLLDIGGGVGAIQHELLDLGVQSAVDVEASTAYINAAKEEAHRRGFVEQIRFVYGNFVDLAASLPAADIVTLNRVICCYDDMVSLVNRSAEHTRGLYGLVYPRSAWWNKLALLFLNLLCKLQKNPYRAYAHPTGKVEALIEQHNLRRIFYTKTLVWQVAVYSR